MRILMLSWEFPPRVVGGLAQHVYDLSAALATLGEEVHVITCSAPGSPQYELVNGVHVHRFHTYDVSSPHFVTWVAQFNIAMLEKALSLLNEIERVYIIHAHDWLVAYAARALKHALRLPLIATIHATEYGRNGGLHNDIQRHISDVEWWLTYEAWKIICCSHYMKNEVRQVFNLPEDKIEVIYNGVNPARFAVHTMRVTRDYYAAPNEQIVFYVGRLVREKGVQVLLEAAPQILARHPQAKFIIAGKGPYAEELHRLAAALGIAQKVYFTGYVDDETRNNLYSWADVAVFPSLYEPFGIVALEAMAARVPVVVADTGGLSEIVEHGVDGLKFYPGNSRSLADMVVWLLKDRQLAQGLRQKAFKKVQEKFSWRDIALKTRRLYQQVWKEYRHTPWPHDPAARTGSFLSRFSKMLARGGMQ